MAWFNDVGNWVKNVFNKLIAAAKKFIEQAFDVGALIIIAELKDFAIKVIQELATTDLDNEAKRKEALAKEEAALPIS